MPRLVTGISIGISLLLAQEQERKQDRTIHLDELTCQTFTQLPQQEQRIIMAWRQAYYLPEHGAAVIDVEKLLSDRTKLAEHCIDKPEDDVISAAEAVLGK
jgi:hypothetical protein